MPTPLDPAEVRRQLTHQGIPEDAVVVEIMHLNSATDLGIDQIVGGARRSLEGPQVADFARGLSMVMGRHRQLVVLGDLYLEGNEPDPGVTWVINDRRKGVLTAIFALLLQLQRHGTSSVDKLRGDPNRLVVGTIEDDQVKIQAGQGASMIHFIESRAA